MNIVKHLFKCRINNNLSTWITGELDYMRQTLEIVQGLRLRTTCVGGIGWVLRDKRRCGMRRDFQQAGCSIYLTRVRRQQVVNQTSSLPQIWASMSEGGGVGRKLGTVRQEKNSKAERWIGKRDMCSPLSGNSTRTRKLRRLLS